MRLGYTKIGFCKCGQPFERKRGRKRLYCDICAINEERKWKRNHELKRPKRNEYLRKKMALYRKLGTVQDKQKERRSVDVIGKPPESKIDPVTDEVIPPTPEEWKRYHNKLKKMIQQTVGGYQDYEEVDNDEN